LRLTNAFPKPKKSTETIYSIYLWMSFPETLASAAEIMSPGLTAIRIPVQALQSMRGAEPETAGSTGT
jgi:hypothetical protein